ncbi:hypothetical protein POM88_049922 [Heracleum sosnowskyi]|uniref:Glutaminyl-tRNA synthetase class Ib non-specific RNA-binding domain-containing protein n=1 Tax=Heracleum sosnowskyi TaxID=360622 RepID=A0AAD8GZB7_9APIA|nr:hypothetical protein POM88_049922 [Heracleum sosnowskyi]
MSKRDPQDLKHILGKIGVNKDARIELHKHSNIISKLLTVIAEARVNRCSNSVGELIYMVAATFPENALVHRPRLLQYVTTSRIRTKSQLVAAFTHLSTHYSKALKIPEFETACGVGVKDERIMDITKEAVNEICEANKEKIMVQSYEENFEEVLVYVAKKYSWADPAIFEDYIQEKLRHCWKETYVDDKKSQKQNIEEEPRKIKVRVKGLNIAKASAKELKSFRQRIRDKITTARKAPYAKVFFLPSRKDARKHPFFLLKICTGSYEVTFIYGKSNLYSVGYITSEEKKVKLFRFKEENIPNLNNKKEVTSDEEEDEEDEEEEEVDITTLIGKIPELKILNLDIDYVDLPISYRDLQILAGKDRSDIELGQKQLEDAIHKFCKKDTSVPELAKAMIVVIQMFPEAWRFSDVEKFIDVNYNEGKAPGKWLTGLQTKWAKLSRELRKWIITKNPFTYDLDGQGSSYSAKEIARAILIAKNSKGIW